MATPFMGLGSKLSKFRIFYESINQSSEFVMEFSNFAWNINANGSPLKKGSVSKSDFIH